MEYIDFRKNALKFYIENYNFVKMENKNYIYKEYNDFYFIIHIVKSYFDKHYKIVSNYYFKELHQPSEIISPENCDELIFSDIQRPENLFSEEFINNKTDEEIYSFLDKIFNELDYGFTNKGVKYIYKIQPNKNLYTFKPNARNYILEKRKEK